MIGKRTNELGVGCLIITALGLMMWMALQVGAFDLRKRIYVTTHFENAAGLNAGAVVAVAGVQVGTVDSLELDDGRAKATLGLYAGENLPAKTTARIRSRSVLGEKYVELMFSEKTGSVLADGDNLKVEQEQVEIDQLVNALEPLVTGDHFEALNKVLSMLLDGIEEDPERISRMLKNLETILDKGAVTAEGLPDFFDEASDSMSRMNRTLTMVDRLGARAESALIKVEAMADGLEKSIQKMPEMADDLGPTLKDLRAIAAFLRGQTSEIEAVLANVEALNSDEIRRILRDEGIRIRFWDRKERRKNAKNNGTR